MKTTLKHDREGLALLWPRIIIVIVFRLRPLAKEAPSVRKPMSAPVERTYRRRTLSQKSMYER